MLYPKVNDALCPGPAPKATLGSTKVGNPEPITCNVIFKLIDLVINELFDIHR